MTLDEVFVKLSERFGWSPDVIANMTLPQIQIYLGQRDGGKVSMSLAEYMALSRAVGET